MLEAKIRRDLAPELTEAEIRKLIQIYQAKPEGIVELAEKIKRVVEQRAAALAGVLDPQARALIEKAFDAELKALAYRGPV
jgi:tRNA U55 pseudouridine synthase TruB